MKSMEELIYEIASSHEGTWEWSAGTNPKIMQWFADAGHPEIKDDSTPWCAAFANGVLAELGMTGTNSLLARSFLEWGEEVPLEKAPRGAIVVFRRGVKPWQGHVGFLNGFTGTSVSVLGGNQSDQVNIKNYPRKDLLSVRVPKKKRENIAQSTTIQSAVAAASGLVPSFAGLSETVQIMGMVLAALALLYIMYERKKKWDRGDR